MTRELCTFLIRNTERVIAHYRLVLAALQISDSERAHIEDRMSKEDAELQRLIAVYRELTGLGPRRHDRDTVHPGPISAEPPNGKYRRWSASRWPQRFCSSTTPLSITPMLLASTPEPLAAQRYVHMTGRRLGSATPRLPARPATAAAWQLLAAPSHQPSEHLLSSWAGPARARLE
jgi:hypothetical protein